MKYILGIVFSLFLVTFAFAQNAPYTPSPDEQIRAATSSLAQIQIMLQQIPALLGQIKSDEDEIQHLKAELDKISKNDNSTVKQNAK